MDARYISRDDFALTMRDRDDFQSELFARQNLRARAGDQRGGETMRDPEADWILCAIYSGCLSSN
jgi:hypothetical protein